MTTKSSQSGSVKLAKILAEMNKEGGFPIAIITDQHGFPIASAADPGQDADTQSAVVALVQKTAIQASNQLGLAPTDEISLYDTKGRRLICRPFKANNHQMILAIIIPYKKQTYRRLTNKTVSAIRQEWKL